MHLVLAGDEVHEVQFESCVDDSKVCVQSLELLVYECVCKMCSGSTDFGKERMLRCHSYILPSQTHHNCGLYIVIVLHFHSQAFSHRNNTNINPGLAFLLGLLPKRYDDIAP